MQILDMTDTLGFREKDAIASSLLNKYFGNNSKYPTSVEGIIVRPLGFDAYEAELIVEGQDTVTMKFSGRKLLDKAVKLPKRDLNDYNIR